MVAGPINESTTWTLADSPYTMTGDVSVAAGVILTIEAGVEVRAALQSVELNVAGHLHAVGTANQPITFTSSADSGPDQWGGLVFDGGSGAGSGLLRHVTVRYGGGNSVRSGNITARNVTDGIVEIRDSRIYSAAVTSLGSTSYGVYLQNSHMHIVDSHIAGNGKQAGDYGVFVQDATSALTLTGTIFERNMGWPLAVFAADLPRLADNQYIQNMPNRVLIFESALSSDTTLPAQSDLRGYEVAGVLGFAERGLTVPTGITLTVEPNVALYGQPGGTLIVQGRLHALGSPTAPITLTSTADTGPDEWGGLFFDGGSGYLRHATVRYAGQGSVANANIAARDVADDPLTIESSHIYSAAAGSLGSTSYGIYASNSRVIISDTLVDNIGKGENDVSLYATGAGSVLTVANSTIADSPGIGIAVNSAASAHIQCSQIARHQAGGIDARSNAQLTVLGSDIRDNVLFGLQSENGSSAQARYNWWGGAVGPFHPSLNSNGIVASQIIGNADFAPWLETGPKCAPLHDVILHKTATPDPVIVGFPLTYTLRITNASPTATSVTGLVLTDTLPTAVTTGAPVAGQGTCTTTAGQIVCALGTLAPGATTSVTLQVTPTVSGALLNQAHIAIVQPDVAPSNNAAATSGSAIADSTQPVIQALSPESLEQGGIRSVVITGLNFAPAVTVTLAPSTTSETAPAPVMGVIRTANATTIQADFDVTDIETMGAWRLTVHRADGARVSRPIFINAPLIWLDYDWDGIRGFPIAPPGQERRSSLAMYNLGYSEGFALMTITPPDPGLIRLKIGALPPGSIWDSTSVTIGLPVSVTLLVPISPGQEVNVPLYWGVSPGDVDFGPAAISQSNRRLRPGQNRQVSFRGLQGAAKDQTKSLVRNVILNTVCENLKDRLAAHYNQGGDPSLLDNAIDATLNELQNATDPRNVFKTIADKLAGTPMPVNLLVAIGKCAGALANSFIGNFHSYTGQLADQICRDKAVEAYVIDKVANQWRGRVAANRALIIAYSRPPGSCRRQPTGYDQNLDGQVRGPWDPNAKSAYPVRSCPWDEAEGMGQCLYQPVPMIHAADPITYIVQFENKAEATAPATSIVITDLLDANLDPATVKILGTSHPTATHPALQFSTEVDGQLLTLRFDNIELPPNTSPPQGEGYVIFAVHPRADLPVGTEIHNQASIVFDFNPAITTAEVIHRLVDELYAPAITR